MPQKRNLGVGKDAHMVTYYNDKDIAKMFGHPRYVIKGDEIVTEEGDIRETRIGVSISSNPHFLLDQMNSFDLH